MDLLKISMLYALVTLSLNLFVLDLPSKAGYDSHYQSVKDAIGSASSATDTIAGNANTTIQQSGLIGGIIATAQNVGSSISGALDAAQNTLKIFASFFSFGPLVEQLGFPEPLKTLLIGLSYLITLAWAFMVIMFIRGGAIISVG